MKERIYYLLIQIRDMKNYNLIIKNTLTGEIRSINRRLSDAHKDSILKNLFNERTGIVLIRITELDEE